jgi:hypothetical protein
MYDVLDTLNFMSYNVSICAAGAAKKEYKKIMNKAPKPIERPTLGIREKPKPKFLTGKELQKIMTGINSAHAAQQESGEG